MPNSCLGCKHNKSGIAYVPFNFMYKIPSICTNCYEWENDDQLRMEYLDDGRTCTACKHNRLGVVYMSSVTYDLAFRQPGWGGNWIYLRKYMCMECYDWKNPTAPRFYKEVVNENSNS